MQCWGSSLLALLSAGKALLSKCVVGAVPFGRAPLRKCSGVFLASRGGLFVVVNHDRGVHCVPHHPSLLLDFHPGRNLSLLPESPSVGRGNVRAETSLLGAAVTPGLK